MTTLRDLDACNMEKRIGSTIQKEWDKNPREAFWLVGKAHSHGTMTRRELIRITLLMIEDSVKLAPKASQDCISELWKWVNGDDSIDLEKVRAVADAAAEVATVATYDAADATYDAADAAVVAADAAVVAADATYDAADAAYLNNHKKIYSITTCEEICKYFKDMNKDKEIV